MYRVARIPPLRSYSTEPNCAMGDAETKTPTLDDLMTVNDELTALVDAGVGLELESGESEADLASMYARFSATLGRRISHGLNLEEALRKSGDDIPRNYRALMLLGLRFDQLDLALDSTHALATTAAQSRFIVRAGLAYPLIVASLAYVGMIAFLWWLVPLLVTTYNVPGLTPGRWLVVLDSARASLPFWVAIPPALLVIGVIGSGWRRGVRGRPRRRPADPLHLTDRLRSAQFAEICAALLEAGAPKSEAIELAAGLSGRAVTAAAGLATQPVEPLPEDIAMNALDLPPLLTYALAGTKTAAESSRALRAAAAAYRQIAVVRQHRLQRLLPLMLLVFVGGGIVLLYGLMLFLPLSELLKTLAQ